MTDLGTLVTGGFQQNKAVAINNHSQIVGSSYNGTEQHAFLWQNGQLTDLGWFSERLRSAFCSSINNRGQVVGDSLTELGERAFLWPTDQSDTDCRRQSSHSYQFERRFGWLW
jgi:probable HAF family extracellular repeat protein